ncbi:MAG TPA: hypothetical protein VK645_15635 [Chitinophagaceae bacterium]|nr:hypothetical protein [Chitinophagaceae bacterium]
MKKLLIIGSTIVAFSAVNLFANSNSNAHTLSSYNVSDTVPKKDTTKKDTTFAQLNENNAYVASLDTVPKKDTTKKDTTFLAMR